MRKNRIYKSALCLILTLAMLGSNIMVYASEDVKISTDGQALEVQETDTEETASGESDAVTVEEDAGSVQADISTATLSAVSAEQTVVIRNIFYAVETGGMVYGKCRYDDVTAAYANSSNETAITIGAGQWFATEAKDLLNLIRTTDKNLFAELDTAGIAADLDNEDWNYYQIDPAGEKGKCIAAIISSDVGIQCQDQMMDDQISYYLETAQNAGVTELGGQIMYAETMHCGGKSAANRILGHTEQPYTAENYYKALTTTWPEDANFNSPISGPEGSTYYNRHTKIYGWVTQYLGEGSSENEGSSNGNTGTSGGNSSGNTNESSGNRKNSWIKVELNNKQALTLEGWLSQFPASARQTDPKAYWVKTSDGSWYLYDSNDTQLYGWQYVKFKWYYLSWADGKMLYGWQKIGGEWYYFGTSSDGAMSVGWKTIDGELYYFGEAEDGARKTGWQKTNGKKYYLDPETGAAKKDWQKIDGKWYYFYEDGHMASSTYIGNYYIGADGVWVPELDRTQDFTNIAGGQKTIKNLLQNALKPVGSTLYIWGGGHDTGSGGDGCRYGVNPQWKEFYMSQDASYDYEDYLYSYGNGLDCSGFVGWSIYNTVYTKSNVSWSITTSTGIAKLFAQTKGWGTLLQSPSTFKPGDVVSMSGHTYIVIGQCDDGSLVLVHSTPQAVQISGTCTPSGGWSSEARSLAQLYMDRYYPDWYFTSQGCGTNYFTNVTVNRWSVDGSGIMRDPNGYQNMSAEEVLADLFCEN